MTLALKDLFRRLRARVNKANRLDDVCDGSDDEDENEDEDENFVAPVTSWDRRRARRTVHNDDALMEAVRLERWQECRRLLAGPEASRLVAHRERWSILHWACARRDTPPDVVEVVARTDPSALTWRTPSGGSTPLHFACDEAPPATLELLLRLSPEAAAMRDFAGGRPLRWAGHRRREPRFLRALTEACPDAARDDNDAVTRGFLNRWGQVIRNNSNNNNENDDENADYNNDEDEDEWRRTFHALLKARAGFAPSETPWSPLRETLKFDATVTVPRVVLGRVLRCSSRAEFVTHDADRNFPLHLLCAGKRPKTVESAR